MVKTSLRRNQKMALTEKQIKRRMDEAWKLHYKQHEMES